MVISFLKIIIISQEARETEGKANGETCSFTKKRKEEKSKKIVVLNAKKEKISYKTRQKKNRNEK